MAGDGLFKTILANIVEVDETYVGGAKRGKRGRGSENKTPVVGLVERNGEVRAMPIENVKAKTLLPIIREYVDTKDTIVMTDDLRSYSKVHHEYEHCIIKHSAKEYVRDGYIHTNTIEGFWSLLKRGIVGIYHYVSKKHLHRYCDEFQFRYNTKGQNEGSRFDQTLKQLFGDRLMYQDLIAQ